MKKFSLLLFFLLVIVGIIVAVVGYFWWQDNSGAVSNDATNVRFVIPKGSSATQVANELYSTKLIRNPLAFKIYVQLTDKASSIKPGEFTLRANMSLIEVVARIVQGPDELWVTIPEGLRREEVAIKVMEQLEITDTLFYQDFIDASDGFEGYLFPDTYLFPTDVTAVKVVEKMRATFEDKYGQASKESTLEGKSKNEAVVMASIIERESRSNSERPVVAGILWKRLDSPGWLIQADATVQYAVADSQLKSKYTTLSDWWPTLTKADLETDSPYNTYLYKDLPPAPIANPGLVSIKAALNPENSQYWFYIHDEEGMIHYAVDQAGHNSNIQRYLR